VLQAGSVIEREFSHDLICAVTGLSEAELLSCLSSLKDAELLYERGLYPRLTYIFRHALTREVVYESILTRRRRKLHAQIGTAIEELRKDDLLSTTRFYASTSTRAKITKRQLATLNGRLGRRKRELALRTRLPTLGRGSYFWKSCLIPVMKVENLSMPGPLLGYT